MDAELHKDGRLAEAEAMQKQHGNCAGTVSTDVAPVQFVKVTAERFETGHFTEGYRSIPHWDKSVQEVMEGAR